MIRINLTDGYYITIERGAEYTLCRTKVAKPDVVKECNEDMQKTTNQIVGYYTSLDNAIKRYLTCVQDAVSDADLDSIKHYAELVDKVDEVAITAIVGALKRGGLFELIEQEKRKKKKGDAE